MSVEISPANTLGFPRPLTQLVKRSLLIHNPNSSPIAFKVKTTAPKQYCVRPNSGRVEAGESIEVQVLLQPLATEPPPHAKCKDKFLVQSAYIAPDEEMKTLAEMWAQTEKTNKTAIHEQKVKCAYLPAEDGSTGANGIPEESEEAANATNGEHSRLDESPRLAFVAPGDGLSRWTTVPDKEYDPTLFRNMGMSYWEVDPPKPRTPTKNTKPEPQHTPPSPSPFLYNTIISIQPVLDPNPVQGQNASLQPQQIFSAAHSSPVHATNGDHAKAVSSAPIPPTAEAPPVSAPAPTNEPPLPALTVADTQKVGSPTNVALEKSLAATTSDSDKLNVALKEIDRLRAQLSDAQGPQVTGLRKRGGVGSVQAGAETAVEKTKEVVAGTSGVPIEVVGGLLLAVFVLTYLFF